jgi:hypothetical protein
MLRGTGSFSLPREFALTAIPGSFELCPGWKKTRPGYSISKIPAAPMPPPTHIVTMP